MNKKKLMLVAPSLKQGGFQRVCARTAQLLSECFDVYVLLFDGSDIAYSLKDIPVISIDVKAQKGAVNKIINVFKRIHRVKALKKEYQIEISYSFGMSANLINVLTRVGDQIWCGMRSYVDLDTTTLKLVCKKADKVIICSKVLEYYVKERCPNANTTTIYNPFHVEDLLEESKKDIDSKDRTFFEKEGPIVAAMGREDVLKGYWHLIKAFSKIEVPDARLCIIGNGDFKNEKQLVKDLKLGKKVYFTGGKSNPFAYLKYADVYVMSSIHEGFPNALVEAMALGIPVVSTNCETGPAEILAEDFTKIKDSKDIEYAEYGVLVPALAERPNYDAEVMEPEESILAEAITKLLLDKELCATYIKKEAERVKVFSTQKYVNTFIELAENR